MDERYLRPAISPDEAVDAPAVEPEQIGMTPAMSASERSRVYTGPTTNHPSVLRVRMRQATAASERLRGDNVKWSTNKISESPARGVHTPAVRQESATSPRVATNVREREYANDTPAKAPMERALRGTVKRMIAQSSGFERPFSNAAEANRGVSALSRGGINPDAVNSLIDRVAREAFDAPKIRERQIGAEAFTAELMSAASELASTEPRGANISVSDGDR